MPINSGSNSSAGVYTGERNNSFRARAVSTSVGAIVGPSVKGRANEATLVVDVDDFIRKFGEGNASMTYMHHCARAFLQESDRLYVVRVARNALYGGVRVSTVDNFCECRNFVNGFDDPDDYVFDDQDILAIYGSDPSDANNDIRILIYPDTDDPEQEMFVLTVYEGTSQIPVEVYRATLREKLDGFGRQLSIETQVNEASYSRIQVRVNHDHPDRQMNDGVQLVNALAVGELTHGYSGDDVTQSDIINGWNLFEDREEVSVNLLINAGYTDPSVQLRMIEIAEERDDCFAILDAPSNSQEAQEVVNYRRNVLNANSSYGALYSPDILVRDTLLRRDLYLPPSGHVSAVFARTDRVSESWFAPAGLRRGQINALGVRHTYRQGHRDLLAENQINPIRVMAGQGIVVWGAETLSAIYSSLSNINVRRLLSLLKRSIAETAEVGVYEQNDDFLRIQLRAIAEGILAPIRNGRGLYGYEVICDERNNTPELMANGDVMLDVYIDPVLPAKQIHLNAIVPRTGQIEFAVSQMN